MDRHQSDYRYLVIPKGLREKLDDFYALIKTTHDEWNPLNDLAKRVVVEQTDRFTGRHYTILDWGVQVQRPGEPMYQQIFGFSNALAGGETVVQLIERTYPRGQAYTYFVEGEYAEQPGRKRDFIDWPKAAEIFREAEEQFNANELVIQHNKRMKEILAKGEVLWKEIGELVTEPWKV